MEKILIFLKSIKDNDGNDTTLMAESDEELKSLLMKVKEEIEKVSYRMEENICKLQSNK